MGRGNINQRLNGLNPLSYMGDNAYQPPEFVTDNRPPTSNDSMNFELGTIWLDTVTVVPPTANNIWMLVALRGGVATWVSFSAGIMTLTSNSGGPVSPTAGNINVVGDGTTIVGVGTPGTSTITFSTSGTGVISTLTSNSGGAVSPLAGNINVVGDGTTIVGVGVPGTHTITFSASGTGLISTLTGNSGGAVSPLAGNINVIGSGVITVVGNPGTHTLTITPSGSIASSFPTDSGTATPSAGVLNVLGGTAARDINTSGSGNTIHVDLNNAITLGDLSVIGAGSNALSATTGDINIAAANLKLPQTLSANQGVIKLGGDAWFHGYGGTADNNVFVGRFCGNFTLTSGVAGGNTGIGVNVLQALTTGHNNDVFGNSSGNLITTGIENLALGTASLINLTTGNYNVLVGTTTGANYTSSESNNILLGHGVAGTVGESNVMRVGLSTGSGTGQLAKSFVAGIRGVTTDANDAIAVLISSTGQLGTVSSSLRYKENVTDIGAYSDAIFSLRPVVFNYKNHSPESKSYGLIAEEVEQVMPKLVVYNEDGEPETVKYHDLVPMLLNEIQKLEKRVEILENR